MRRTRCGGYGGEAQGISIQSKFSAGEENALARFNNEKGQKKIGIAGGGGGSGGDDDDDDEKRAVTARATAAAVPIVLSSVAVEAVTVIHLGARYIIIASTALFRHNGFLLCSFAARAYFFFHRAPIMPPPQLFG